MRIVRELGNRKTQIIVLTGNGKDDLRVLRYCSKIYNGKKLIWYPETPLKRIRAKISPLTRATIPPTTIKALGAIKHCVEKYKVPFYLFLIDREHIKKGEEVEKIKKTLIDKGFRKIKVTQVRFDLYYVECFFRFSQNYNLHSNNGH